MKIQYAMTICLCLTFATLFTAGCKDTTVRGTSGISLTIQPPQTAVVIKRGEMQSLEVALVRSGFSDAVKVDLIQLPAGVTAQKASLNVETDKATYILTANPAADLVANHQAKLIATGPGGMKATQYVTITVTE
ncbi:MAG: hypothetical protein WD768_06760 [Phycisphaeraceae bacterium]